MRVVWESILRDGKFIVKILRKADIRISKGKQ